MIESRQKGQQKTRAMEPGFPMALDSSSFVPTKADLTNLANWKDGDNKRCYYTGKVVEVADDGNGKPAVFQYVGRGGAEMGGDDDIQNIDNWQLVGTTEGTDFVQVDMDLHANGAFHELDREITDLLINKATKGIQVPVYAEDPTTHQQEISGYAYFLKEIDAVGNESPAVGSPIMAVFTSTEVHDYYSVTVKIEVQGLFDQEGYKVTSQEMYVSAIELDGTYALATAQSEGYFNKEKGDLLARRGVTTAILAYSDPHLPKQDFWTLEPLTETTGSITELALNKFTDYLGNVVPPHKGKDEGKKAAYESETGYVLGIILEIGDTTAKVEAYSFVPKNSVAIGHGRMFLTKSFSEETHPQDPIWSFKRIHLQEYTVDGSTHHYPLEIELQIQKTEVYETNPDQAYRYKIFSRNAMGSNVNDIVKQLHCVVSSMEAGQSLPDSETEVGHRQVDVNHDRDLIADRRNHIFMDANGNYFVKTHYDERYAIWYLQGWKMGQESVVEEVDAKIFMDYNSSFNGRYEITNVGGSYATEEYVNNAVETAVNPLVAAVNNKLDKNQGADNAGKVLKIDADGDVIPVTGGEVNTYAPVRVEFARTLNVEETQQILKDNITGCSTFTVGIDAFDADSQAALNALGDHFVGTSVYCHYNDNGTDYSVMAGILLEKDETNIKIDVLDVFQVGIGRVNQTGTASIDVHTIIPKGLFNQEALGAWLKANFFVYEPGTSSDPIYVRSTENQPDVNVIKCNLEDVLPTSWDFGQQD